MKKVYRLIMACMLMFLTGCMKLHMTIDVSKDAEAEGTMEVLVRKDFLALGGDARDVMADMQETYQKEFPDCEVTTIREEDGDIVYGGIRIAGMKDLEIYAAKEGAKIVVEIPLNKVQSDIDEYVESYDSSLDVDQLKENGLAVTMAVNMPYWPSSNVGEVQGKTVFIDLMTVPEGTEWITITCMREEVFYGLIAGGVAILLLVIFFVVKKKKKA